MKKTVATALCLILFAAFVTPLFSGCSALWDVEQQTGPEEHTTAEPADTEEKGEPVRIHQYDPDNVLMAEAYLEAAPGADLDGMDVFLTGPMTSLLSPDGAKYISKEISERNRAVEKKLNVKLDFSAVDADTMFDDAAAAIAAGMYYTDVMLLPVGSVGKFYSGGELSNLNSLPFLDLSRPYFDQGSVAALTAGGFTLGFSADACPTLSYLPALYYNRAALTDGSLEEAARSGSLTWDLVLAAAEEGKAALGEDAAAFGAGFKLALPETVYASFGGAVTSTAGEYPTVAISEDILARSSSISKAVSGAFIKGDKSGKAFKEGAAVFMIDYVGKAKYRHAEGVDWAILPLPTEKEGDVTRSLVSSDCPVFTVIAGTETGEETALVLTALCAASYGVVPEHYVDEVLVTSMRSNEAADMLDIIRKTAVFDLAVAVSGESDEILDGTLGAVRSAATGDVFAAAAAAANDALRATFD